MPLIPLTRRAALAGMGLACASPWVAPAEPAARVQALPVAEGVWFAQGEAALGSAANRNFVSNAGFVVTDGGVVVIDALGSPVLAAELVAEIRRITPRPIRHVIVTHYHADHIYGLQVFKAAGATVLAHPAGREYLNSDAAQRRLEASRQELAPWIDAGTRLVAADRWLDRADTLLRVGSVELRIRHVGPAHTPEDLVVFIPARGVLFAGDLVFRGRIPFVGQADSRQWIESLNRLIEWGARIIVPGHGPLSNEPQADLELTRDYLLHLRKTMGDAAASMEPFEAAYARADWSRFERVPLFRAANRMNAFNTYLLMEQQGTAGPQR
jgi:glyoxylase-like metal-dependent hydrolase (beta-lactamase superfamily II)